MRKILLTFLFLIQIVQISAAEPRDHLDFMYQIKLEHKPPKLMQLTSNIEEKWEIFIQKFSQEENSLYDFFTYAIASHEYDLVRFAIEKANSGEDVKFSNLLNLIKRDKNMFCIKLAIFDPVMIDILARSGLTFIHFNEAFLTFYFQQYLCELNQNIIKSLSILRHYKEDLEKLIDSSLRPYVISPPIE
ncbi:MAG: hypothetical protein CMP11_09500 [Zetaproteobacteria bacterium]|nr:hypothetical protein [Pseudobdellovibrionaceae bacterium]